MRDTASKEPEALAGGGGLGRAGNWPDCDTAGVEGGAREEEDEDGKGGGGREEEGGGG